MNVEIERKFLVHKNLWKEIGKPEGVFIQQAYLLKEVEKNVRIRLKGEQGFLTIKGKTENLSRPEFEYEIPVEDAKKMIELFGKDIIEKIRYHITFEQYLWEVDVFFGNNLGLIVAEIELESEDSIFPKPDWIAKEVSHDSRYFNSNLSKHPYQAWEKKDL